MVFFFTNEERFPILGYYDSYWVIWQYLQKSFTQMWYYLELSVIAFDKKKRHALL